MKKENLICIGFRKIKIQTIVSQMLEENIDSTFRGLVNVDKCV